MNNLTFRQVRDFPEVRVLIDSDKKTIASILDLTGNKETAEQLIERIIITVNAYDFLVTALRTIMDKDTYPSTANDFKSTGAFFKIAKDGLTKAGVL